MTGSNNYLNMVNRQISQNRAFLENYKAGKTTGAEEVQEPAGQTSDLMSSMMMMFMVMLLMNSDGSFGGGSSAALGDEARKLFEQFFPDNRSLDLLKAQIQAQQESAAATGEDETAAG